MTKVRPTVLLVEDDPNDVFLMERAFQRSAVEAEIRVLNDGEAAINYLMGNKQFADRVKFPMPSLMLLDLKLPKKSGLDVVAFVRSQPVPLKRLPIIMLTSSRQAIDINKAYLLGANSYFVKPGGFDSLLEIVNNFNEYWLVYNQRPDVRE